MGLLTACKKKSDKGSKINPEKSNSAQDHTLHKDIGDDSSLHCHVIRKTERDYLIDFFRRRREGALLVSGKRGVGKTSVVIYAILELRKILLREGNKKDQMNKEKLLPILVNAPNFENRNAVQSENKPNDGEFLEFKHSVLQNLVRSLYQAAWRDDIIGGIDINKFDTDRLRSFKKDRTARSITNFLRSKASKKDYKPEENKKTLTTQEIALKNKISQLFRRAVATEVKTQADFKELVLDKYIQEKKTTSKADLSLVTKTMAVLIPSALAAAFLLPVAGLDEGLAKVLPIVISVTPPRNSSIMAINENHHKSD